MCVFTSKCVPLVVRLLDPDAESLEWLQVQQQWPFTCGCTDVGERPRCSTFHLLYLSQSEMSPVFFLVPSSGFAFTWMWMSLSLLWESSRSGATFQRNYEPPTSAVFKVLFKVTCVCCPCPCEVMGHLLESPWWSRPVFAASLRFSLIFFCSIVETVEEGGILVRSFHVLESFLMSLMTCWPLTLWFQSWPDGLMSGSFHSTRMFPWQNPSTSLSLKQHLKLPILNFNDQQVNENVISRMYVCSPRYNFRKDNLFVLSFNRSWSCWRWLRRPQETK